MSKSSSTRRAVSVNTRDVVARRDGIARSLELPCFRVRVVPNKKAYNRKKNKDQYA